MALSNVPAPHGFRLSEQDARDHPIEPVSEAIRTKNEARQAKRMDGNRMGKKRGEVAPSSVEKINLERISAAAAQQGKQAKSTEQCSGGFGNKSDRHIVDRRFTAGAVAAKGIIFSEYQTDVASSRIQSRRQ